MDSESFGRLIYLSLLGLVIVGWFFAQNRQKMNKTLQQFVLWGLLFGGVAILYGLRDDLRLQVMPRATVAMDGDRIVLERASNRHFFATLRINGQNVIFVIDTGATDMVLSKSDAKRVGFDPGSLAYFQTAQTANGEVRTARVKLAEVVFATYTDKNVTAWVNDSDMEESLLGMSYLSRFSKLEISGDKLYLTR